MTTHCWNQRLVRLLPACVLPGYPIGLPRLKYPFHSENPQTSSLASRRGVFGCLLHAMRLVHTRADSSSELIRPMDLECASHLDNRGDYKHHNIIPTLSARISCSGDIVDGLMEALMSFGASSVSIEDGSSGGTMDEEVSPIGPEAWDKERRHFWNQSQLIAMFPPGQNVEESVEFAFNSVGLSEGLPYEVKEVAHQNWQQQVKDMFQPLKIADNLWIVPKWSIPPDDSATNVMLDPGLAFGTGDHPTTQLCLQWLNHIVKGGEYILDYGTGSGILAISGLKLGATQAVGVDIDPVAVSSAKQNAALNGYGSDSLQVFLAEICGDDPIPCEDTKFDVVVANILLNPLLELSERLLGYCRPGGLLGVSGILETQVDEVKEKYSSFLDHIEVMTKDGWASISGTKKGTQR